MAHPSGKVVSIQSFRPVVTVPLTPVSQQRLAAGAKLLEEQQRIAEAVQQFKLELDRDLSAGAEVEAGELIFDRELKIVRRNRGKRLQVSIR